MGIKNMEISGTLHLKEAPNFARIVQQEMFATPRMGCSVTEKKDDVELTIHATDAVAFRAVMQSLTQMLLVYDKIEKEVKGQNIKQ